MSFSTAHIDYLQRASGAIPPLAPGAGSVVHRDLRRLWRIHGLGVLDKRPQRASDADARPHLPTLDLLMGLYGFRVPVAFRVRGEPDGLQISLGTFIPGVQDASAKHASQAVSDDSQMVKAALQSVFHSVDVRADDPLTPEPPAAAMVLGIPTVKPPDPSDGSLPLDRLARAMRGDSWGFLVLAEPMPDATLRDLRMMAAEELKLIEFYLKTLKYPDPLAAHYQELLEVTVGDYSYGLAVGSWRTTVYLTGDPSSCSRLGAVWHGVFSGDRSMHMPIRIWRDAVAPRLVHGWAASDAAAARGPGAFQHHFGHQTILTSDQLAAYVHLPHSETNGFSVRLALDFDTVPSAPEPGPSMTLGEVYHSDQPTTTAFTVGLNSLTKHAFVAGVTGSGKTNTLLHLLAAADAASVPFLVLEPAKTEYRALLNHSRLGARLQVFTLGNENVSPFRLNPFECLEGTPISAHIDLLRAAFGASFGMWTPLPQVLEQCIHAVYEDRGWDLASGRNARLSGRPSPLAFPTLTDLVRKVEELTPTLGYDDKIASDIRAALKTRINGLRAGGKGLMLDVRQSLPAEVLFEAPTVLELEGMGDEDDKAFMMALILIRVWQYQRRLGKCDTLRHILVVEEAHRLLASVAARGAEEGNARAKAVEAFANMLAEVRAYGQGVIIADQSPTRLAPEVIKNTNLKVAHRIVARDDRAALAGAMAMTDEQSLALATFTRGLAAVFKEGEDSPLLVMVTEVKSQLGETWPDDAQVVRDMMSRARVAAFRAASVTHPGCLADAANQPACRAARGVAESAGFQRALTRLVLSVFEAAAVTALWPDLAVYFDAARRPGLDARVLSGCGLGRGAWQYAERRGAAAGWSYDSTTEFAERLQAFLAGLSDRTESGLAELRELLLRLHTREFAPYSHCERICAALPATCLFRYDAAALAADPEVRQEWDRAEQEDLRAGGRARSLDAMLAAAERIVFAGQHGPSVSLRQTALCASQQLMAADPQRLQSARATAMDNLLRKADASGRTSE